MEKVKTYCELCHKRITFQPENGIPEGWVYKIRVYFCPTCKEKLPPLDIEERYWDAGFSIELWAMARRFADKEFEEDAYTTNLRMLMGRLMGALEDEWREQVPQLRKARKG